MTYFRKTASQVGRQRVDGWSPDLLPGLRHWYESRYVSGLGAPAAVSDGQELGTWVDLKGGVNLGTYSTYAKPIYRATGGANGSPTMDFDTTKAISGAITSGGAGILTWYIVAKINNAVDGVLLYGNTSANYYLYKRNSQWRFYNVSGSFEGGTGDTNWHVFTFEQNGASSKIRVDGTQVASGTSAATAITQAVIGWGGYPLNGFMSAVLLVTGTPGSHSIVEKYLGDAYGITVA